MSNAKEFILENSKEHSEAIDHGYYIKMDEPEILEWMEKYAQFKLKNNGDLGDVSGMLSLTENAKSKLEYINGSCIARDFPKEQPTKQWAGAVLDLLEELGLGNYR